MLPVIWQRDAAFPARQSDPILNPPTSFSACSAFRSHGLMDGGEKGPIVKRFNEIGDRPGLYRRVWH
jgi:hypothetical protein